MSIHQRLAEKTHLKCVNELPESHVLAGRRIQFNREVHHHHSNRIWETTFLQPAGKSVLWKTACARWSTAATRTKQAALRFPSFEFLIPQQFYPRISWSMAGLGHSYAFLYPTSNRNSGLSSRERQMNASLHSRHNKAQNTTQRLL